MNNLHEHTTPCLEFFSGHRSSIFARQTSAAKCSQNNFQQHVTENLLLWSTDWKSHPMFLSFNFSTPTIMVFRQPTVFQESRLQRSVCLLSIWIYLTSYIPAVFGQDSCLKLNDFVWRQTHSSENQRNQIKSKEKIRVLQINHNWQLGT